MALRSEPTAAGVAIGGTLLTGGAGGLTGTMAGVLLLGVIQSLINQVGVLTSSYQQVVSGAFLALVGRGTACPPQDPEPVLSSAALVGVSTSGVDPASPSPPTELSAISRCTLRGG
jgi:hypothetical protein